MLLKNCAPWAYYKIAKNLNFEGPLRGPKGHENIFWGKFSVRLKTCGAYYKIAKNPNLEGPFSGLEGYENIFFGIHRF